MTTAMRSALLSATMVCLVAAEEEVASPVACAIAATLFGTVFVIMCLYYLFNWPDPDIRKYSFEVVSSTISIFAAVLLFQSFQGTVEYFMDGRPTYQCIIAAFAHRIFWHAVLQVLLAYLTKSICCSENNKRAILEGGEDGGADEDEMEIIEMNAKCWGLILAHMTGFASINAWGTVQQTAMLSQNWYISWLVVPACLITNIPFLKFTECVRAKIAKSGDDSVDELEKKWDEEVEEAENDITALGLSFLTVQSMKFLFCGTLANVEGEEEEGLTFGHQWSDCIKLYAFGTLCIPVFCWFVMKIKALEDGEEEERAEKRLSKHKPTEEELKEEEEAAEKSEKLARNLDQIVATFVMNMAWSYFYATKWTLGALPLPWGGNTTLLCAVEAVLVSVVGFALIFILDKCADAEWTGDAADECIKGVIFAIGIVVGFSWEQSFDAAVAALGSNTPCPVVTKQLMAIACAMLVIPAWKVYMLPILVHEGWRYGFIAKHATQYLDDEDQESLTHYFGELEHMMTGHKIHIGNPELKKQIVDLIEEQIAVLKEDDHRDEKAIPFLGR